MRFMVIVKTGQLRESGSIPSAESMEKMGAFNEQLMKAGALLSAEGLQPSSKGARITYSGGRPTVTDGPFAETKELIGGFWIVQMKSKDEALEWFSRCPFENGEEIEIRQVTEPEEFAALLSESHRDRYQRFRETLAN